MLVSLERIRVRDLDDLDSPSAPPPLPVPPSAVPQPHDGFCVALNCPLIAPQSHRRRLSRPQELAACRSRSLRQYPYVVCMRWLRHCRPSSRAARRPPRRCRRGCVDGWHVSSWLCEPSWVMDEPVVELGKGLKSMRKGQIGQHRARLSSLSEPILSLAPCGRDTSSGYVTYTPTSSWFSCA